jgi:protein-glutamine gamma-glutamyltransferase
MSPATHTREHVPPNQALEFYFHIFLYLTVLTGFGALASTGWLDLLAILGVGGALLFRGYLLATRQSLLIPEGWTNLLTLAYAAFYALDYFFISGGFLGATVHLVLFVMVVRLFSARRDRDFYFLAVLAFLMVLAAAVLTVDSAFLLTFVVFLLVAVTTFILMEMRQAASKAPIQSKDLTNEQLSRRMAISLSAAAPLIVLLILIGGAAIFFVLPRASAGYLSAYAFRDELATGFSDRVELGQIGEIQQSDAVVMHIRIDGDHDGAHNLKWRGIALNVFNGREWSNPHLKHVVPRLPDASFALWPDGNEPQKREQAGEKFRPIHYRVLLEPVGTNVFFLATAPRTLKGNYRRIAMDGGGAVFNLDAEHSISTYEAWSDVARPSAAELRAASGAYPPEILLENLQLPPLDARIAQLAQAITASAKNNYDRAAALESYLLTHFTYTLQLSRATPRDPIAEFLFVRKQGHCEYFASSMAVMLRTLGIPARLVNGFRGNEFNDLTSQYVIRDRDAHTWVEVYFPGYGWVSFDPTPGGAAQAHTRWSAMMQYADAAQSFWREWVVSYDISHQAQLGEVAIHFTRRSLFRVRHWVRRRYWALLNGARRTQATLTASPGRWSLTAGLAMLLLFLLANWRRFRLAVRRQRLASRPETAPRAAAEIWYQRLTHWLARKGWHKPPEQTPSEFLLRIDDDAVRERVAQFTRHYAWARF